MSQKTSELDELMNQQRRIEQQDSDAEDGLDESHREMKRFEVRVNNSRKQQRLKGPDSDSSDEDAVVSSQPLFKVETPAKQQNLVDSIQNKIRWKEEKEEQEIEQLLRMGGDSAKEKKIRELAQKVKSINLALEKQKTIRRKLEEQLNSSIKANETRVRQEQTKNEQTKQQTTIRSKDDDKQLAEAEKKIMEMRLKNQNMKNELNKAMRVIQREVGQNVNLDELLGQENAWKGRQQKIEKLKARVKQLEDKLNNNGVNVSHMTGFSSNTQQPQSSQQLTVNSLADNRRKEMENMKVQVQALKNQNQLLQNKVKSLTSRKLILENEAKEFKSQFEKKEKLLREKSDNDDKYIALLKQQNDKLKKEERVVTKLVYKSGNNPDSEEIPTLKLSIQKLNAQLQRREEKIRELEQQISSMASRSVEKRPTKKKIEEVEKDVQVFAKQLTKTQQQALYKNWKEGKLKAGSK